MRSIIIYLTVILILASCKNDIKNKTNSVSAPALTLLANTGFYDTSSHSAVNIYNTSYFIHDSVGYFNCSFIDSFYHHNSTSKIDSASPQLLITLGGIKQQNIAVTIHFVQMNLPSDKQAVFVSALNNDAGKMDTLKNIVDSATRAITINTLNSSPTGIYYIKTFGIYPNTGLGFAVSKVSYTYIDSTKK